MTIWFFYHWIGEDKRVYGIYKTHAAAHDIYQQLVIKQKVKVSALFHTTLIEGDHA